MEIMSDEIFDGIEPRILVMDTEHHGSVHKHGHNFFEIVYIEHGFTLHSCNDRVRILTAGDMFVICPDDKHSYNSAYHTNLYNCLFYLDELSGLRDEVMRLPGIEWSLQAGKTELPILHIGLPERREVVLLLEKMKWERQNRVSGWELNSKSLLISFLVLYSRLVNSQLCQKTESGAYYGYVYKVLQYIEDNYTSEITQKEISDYTGLSADYIARRFKGIMSMTPSEYVRKFRVAKSMELLCTTNKSVSEIAGLVGFTDISLYSRVFKQIAGASPAAYRKANIDLI